MSRQASRSSVVAGAIVFVFSVMAVGCANKPAESPKSDSSDDATAEQYPGKDPGQANIEVSPTIAEACGITETDTYFMYNSSKISGQADQLFGKLADCFTSGKLAGKTMNIVGHADPRGDEEYNMVLGGRRADNVKSAIAKKGLAEKQMKTTSRGELEATGTDEAGWAKDRRVAILLAE